MDWLRSVEGIVCIGFFFMAWRIDTVKEEMQEAKQVLEKMALNLERIEGNTSR